MVSKAACREPFFGLPSFQEPATDGAPANVVEGRWANERCKWHNHRLSLLEFELSSRVDARRPTNGAPNNVADSGDARHCWHNHGFSGLDFNSFGHWGTEDGGRRQSDEEGGSDDGFGEHVDDEDWIVVK